MSFRIDVFDGPSYRIVCLYVGGSESTKETGGFFLVCKDLGENSMICSPLAFFCFCLLSGDKLACEHQFHSSRRDQFIVAKRAETTAGQVFPDE